MIASAILQSHDTVIAGVIYDGEDARTMLTSFLTQQPTCGQMHSWLGGGGELDNDDGGNNDHKDDNNDDGERGQRRRPQQLGQWRGQRRPHF